MRTLASVALKCTPVNHIISSFEVSSTEKRPTHKSPAPIFGEPIVTAPYCVSAKLRPFRLCDHDAVVGRSAKRWRMIVNVLSLVADMKPTPTEFIPTPMHQIVLNAMK